MFSRRVRIKIQGGPDRVFRPGDIVSGTVEYKSPAEDRITSLAIDFRGASKVKPAKGTQISKEVVEYFHIQLSLFSGDRTLEPRKSYFWPFDFTFPEMTGPDQTGLYIDSGSLLFDEKPHPLPPSLGPEQSEAASITYHIYAIAQRVFRMYGVNDVLRHEPIVHNIDSLVYRPDVSPRNVHAEPSQPLEQTFKLFMAPKRNLAQKFQHVVAGSGPPPIHSFTVVANPPSMIILGQPIPISFLVRHNETSSAVPGSVPACSYKTIGLTLVSKTYKRCTKLPSNKNITEMKEKRLGTDYGLGAQPLDTSIQTKHFPTDAVKDWPPSFKCYSISRSYDLQISMIVNCQGRKDNFEVQFKISDIKVICAATEQTMIERQRSLEPPPPLPAISAPLDDDELPSYQDISRTEHVAVHPVYSH